MKSGEKMTLRFKADKFLNMTLTIDNVVFGKDGCLGLGKIKVTAEVTFFGKEIIVPLRVLSITYHREKK